MRARLHLVEQAHILDGDHCLVGEGRGQFDLLFRKRLSFHTAQYQYTNRRSFPHKGDAEYRATASDTPDLGPVVFWSGLGIVNVDRFPSKQRAADGSTPPWSYQTLFEFLFVRGRQIEGCSDFI